MCSYLTIEYIAHFLLLIQSQGKITPSADPNSRLTEEEEEGLRLSSTGFFGSRFTSHSLRRRQRSHSVSLVGGSAYRPELLTLEEEGLSRVRLSGSELQKRYRSAFSRGVRTEEVKEMEADEMDLGPPSNVVSSGRRASITTRSITSTSTRPSTPINANTSQPRSRDLHTSSKTTRQAILSSPPSADLPRVRRNSTSALPSTSVPLESASTPVSIPPTANPPSTTPKGNTRSSDSVRRPRSTAPKDATQIIPKPPAIKSKSVSHADRIEEALRVAGSAQVQGAVRAYLAHPAEYTTETHNVAMECLRKSRSPNEPITDVVDLFNQLFDHPSLKPDRRSFEAMLHSFLTRDREILSNINLLENRTLKKKLASAARGPWDGVDKKDAFMTPQEAKELIRLKQEDYLTPALKIYNALGVNADALSSTVVNLITVGACKRERIDVAIAIFGRMEASPRQEPASMSYFNFIKLYGKNQDREGVMAIFEGYLEARAAGLPEPFTSKVQGSRFVSGNSKHRYITTKDFVEGEDRTEIETLGDLQIWNQTIGSLFKCGDAVGAVELVEKIQEEQDQNLPGYPKGPLAASIYGEMISGFLANGDEESALRWYDQLASPLVANTVEPPSRKFYRSCFFAALRNYNTTSTPQSLHALNYIYSGFTSRKDLQVDIGTLVTVIDANLSMLYQTDDLALRHTIADNVQRFTAEYELAEKEGRSATPVGTLSSGLQERIIQALAFAGRSADSVPIFLAYMQQVRQAMDESANQVGAMRAPERWARVGSTGAAAAALGLLPDSKVSGYFPYSYASDARPTLIDATTIVGEVNSVLRKSSPTYRVSNLYESIVVEVYLKAKAAAKGDILSLGLSSKQWFTVIEASAHVARIESYDGANPAFDFPGFELIIDDYLASGVKLLESDNNDGPGLVRALAQGRMPKARIMAVVSVLDPRTVQAIADGQLDLTDQPIESEPLAPETADSAEELQIEAVEAVQPTPVAEPVPTQNLPTPPSTPPTYFATLPVLESKLENLKRRAVYRSDEPGDRASTRIDKLLRDNRPMDAYHALIAEILPSGAFVNPEALGRLVEALGRAGKLNEVRQTYLLAYQGLQSLASNPLAQSAAWVALEDHMVIALAQMGNTPEANIHYARLKESGSAPSADGYAAMILNMNETTDDASVALGLFEEAISRRVAPNVYLFNTLISKLSRARRAKEAITYFELMKTSGLAPSSITYGAVINACCKTGDDVTADFLFREMLSSPGFKPRVPPYNTMIQFYTSTQPDREKALYYYDQLLAAGVAPTGHTYKLLLDAYGSIGTPDAQSMSDVFDRLVLDKKVTVTGAHWASMINAWGCIQQDLDRATSIFDSIAHHPSTRNSDVPLPDAVVYESLLNAFLANSRPDLCAKYLAQMKERGVRMTAYVANTLIKVNYTLPQAFHRFY